MPRTSATRNCSERSWRKLRSGPCGPTASFLIRNSTPIATRTAPPGNSPGEGGSAGEERTGVRTLAVWHIHAGGLYRATRYEHSKALVVHAYLRKLSGGRDSPQG